MSNPNINTAGSIQCSSLSTTNITSDDVICDNIETTYINNVPATNLNYLDVNSSLSQSLSTITGQINTNTFDVSNNKISITNLQNTKLNKTNDTLSNSTLVNCVDASNSLICSQSYCDQKIAQLVNNSPQVMDTLFEISNSLNNDPSFNQTMINQLSLKLNSNGGNGTNNGLSAPLVSNYMYVINTGTSTINQSRSGNAWNAIGSNLSNGHKELNFINYDTLTYNSSSTKAFCFHKMSDASTYNDYLTIYNNGNAKLKGDLVIGSNNLSLTSLNTNLTNNYYTKTQIDETNDTQNTNVTNLSNNLSTNYYTKTNINDNFFTKTNINDSFYNRIEIDDNYYTKTDTNTIFYNKIQTDAKLDGLVQNGSKCGFSKPLGVGTADPTTGNMFHVVGDTTLNGGVNITQQLTLNGTNVNSTLSSQSTSITQNTNNITDLMNHKNRFPKYSFSSAVTEAYTTSGKFKPLNPIRIKFIGKNNIGNVQHFDFPVTFSIKCFFYRSDRTAPGQCSFDLMLLPDCVTGWSNPTSQSYRLNNEIGNNSAFSAEDRKYWTYNQKFETTTGGAGYIWGDSERITETGKWEVTVSIIILFNVAENIYTWSCEALDISGCANKYDVMIY